MKLNLLLIILLIWGVTQAVKVRLGGKASSTENHFKTKFAKSSREIYDIFEFDKNSIFVVTFYIEGDGHEKVIENLEASMNENKAAFDNVVYMHVDASDPYQYGGILYDLDIETACHKTYPYFLIIQDENGQLIHGSKSGELMKVVIEDLLKAN